MNQFKTDEVKDLGLSFLAIGLAFTIAQVGLSGQFAKVLIISLVTAGMGFVLHELGHKLVSQRYGCISHFVADKKMLLVAIGLSPLGIVFAAPGAVMINGRITKAEYGMISAAGPIVNLILAAAFFTAGLVIPSTITTVGTQLNAWIGLFNMIPFLPFDGKKILDWNKGVYGTIIAIGLILLIA
ncbi:MAG: metalloprotease [Candidatus Woesearchaeota archaeon]